MFMAYGSLGHRTGQHEATPRCRIHPAVEHAQLKPHTRCGSKFKLLPVHRATFAHYQEEATYAAALHPAGPTGTHDSSMKAPGPAAAGANSGRNMCTGVTLAASCRPQHCSSAPVGQLSAGDGSLVACLSCRPFRPTRIGFVPLSDSPAVCCARLIVPWRAGAQRAAGRRRSRGLKKARRHGANRWCSGQHGQGHGD